MPTTYRFARHLGPLLLSTLLVSGCSLAAHREPVRVDLAGARAEHWRPNRCGEVADAACTRDSDCPWGPCVSVLPTDAGAFGRDGGHTLALGERVLWQFGDSFTDAGMLSSTAGWSDTHDPLSMRDAAGADGLPVAFLPFTPDEQQFNDAHATPPACCSENAGCPRGTPYCECPAGTVCTQRMALWPGDGIETGDGVATIYYDRQLAGVAPYDFTDAGIGVATVRRDAASAQRLLDANGEPVWLFAAGEPHFARGLRVDGPDGSFFYLYANTNRFACAVDVLLARVPVDGMADRTQYRFWDGAGWSAGLAAAVPVAKGITAGLGSVAWNQHLGAYLSVWSDICTGGDKLALRRAPAPQGPWSDATLVDLAPLGAGPAAYYGMQHPEFGNDAELLVSYFQPVGVVDGQMRLLRLKLP